MFTDRTNLRTRTGLSALMVLMEMDVTKWAWPNWVRNYIWMNTDGSSVPPSKSGSRVGPEDFWDIFPPIFDLIFAQHHLSTRSLSIRSSNVHRCLLSGCSTLRLIQLSNQFKCGMFVLAKYHVCDDNEEQRGASVIAICAGWSTGLFVFIELMPAVSPRCHYRFCVKRVLHVDVSSDAWASPYGHLRMHRIISQ